MGDNYPILIMLSNGFKTFYTRHMHKFNLIPINHMNAITITEAMCYRVS